jgi:hypothetical protein
MEAEQRVVGRFCETPSIYLASGKDALELGVRGRRVREDVRTEKNRLDPFRTRRRTFVELNDRDRCANERLSSGMLITAGGDEGDRTTMLDAVGVGVNPLMPLRGDAERQCPGKHAEKQCRNEATSVLPRIHCADIFPRRLSISK